MKKNEKQKFVKGFTLIELLIVIAIIGILASIVLVNLSSARERARMASYKAAASSLHAQAVILCDTGVAAPAGWTWPAGNTDGAVTIPLACSAAGDITGGRTRSNASTGSATCTATMTPGGITWGGTC